MAIMAGHYRPLFYRSIWKALNHGQWIIKIHPARLKPTSMIGAIGHKGITPRFRKDSNDIMHGIPLHLKPKMYPTRQEDRPCSLPVS